MEGFSTETFVATLALVGSVILIAALLSGLIERSGLPQVAVLLGLGAALGPNGLGLLEVTLDSPILRIVATLSLTLVLFTDALSLDLQEVRRHSLLGLLMVGPGTLLSAALIALAGWALLGLPAPAAMVLGAALASTDPILLRGMLRASGLPGGARLALRLESGMNDVSLLPVVLVAMVFMESGASPEPATWASLALDLFVLGPGAGVVIGLISVAVLDMVRRRIGVRRDYESLYALGVAFTSFAAAEAVHGSGFLAAFAAGLTISALDVELCDCFLEYGETTAEMALLLTFVLLGSSLIWSGLSVISVATLSFAAIALVGRIPILYLALAGIGLNPRSRLLIGWFGPRGLGALLLVLLPIFAGIPGSDQLFAICALVVLLSVALHGGTPLVIARKTPAGARSAPAAPPEPPPALDDRSSTGDSCPLALMAPPPPANGHEPAAEGPGSADQVRIGIEELRRLWAAHAAVTILDVRTERALGHSELQARGALRLPPDQAVDRARALELPRNDWLVAYCA